jgi:hypothetical protein
MGEVKLSRAALQNVEEAGVDVGADVAAIRAGTFTRETLLAHCLNGADSDRVAGWHEYVEAVVDFAKT